MRSKMRASVKILPMWSSLSRCWSTLVRYSSGSQFGITTMTFSFCVRTRHCYIEKIRYLSAIAVDANGPSGCCFESDLPAKRTRKLLVASVANRNRTIKSFLLQASHSSSSAPLARISSSIGGIDEISSRYPPPSPPSPSTPRSPPGVGFSPSRISTTRAKRGAREQPRQTSTVKTTDTEFPRDDVIPSPPPRPHDVLTPSNDRQRSNSIALIFKGVIHGPNLLLLFHVTDEIYL